MRLPRAEVLERDKLPEGPLLNQLGRCALFGHRRLCHPVLKSSKSELRRARSDVPSCEKSTLY